MFLPENIDLAQSEKYILSIRLTSNGFSFCIFSPTDKNVFHYQQVDFSKNLSPTENVQKFFFEVNFFSQPFKAVWVTAVSDRYTTVPDAYFDKKNAKKIFEFNIHGQCGRALHNFISEGAYHVVFDIDEQVYSFLSRNLWNPTFFSHIARLLPFFTTYKAENVQKRCFVDFHDQLISVACFDGEKLLSAHTFSNHQKVNALYNLVNVWEKQSLNQNTDWLFLSGNISDNKESIDTLKQLIKNVEVLKLNSVETQSRLPTDVLVAIGYQ